MDNAALADRLDELTEMIAQLSAQIDVADVPTKIKMKAIEDLSLAAGNLMKIHEAPSEKDIIYYLTRGCLLIGDAQGKVKGIKMVTNEVQSKD